MSADRILGGAAIAFGGFLLLFAIPRHVASTGGLSLNPALFPQIAAWLLMGLGLLQILFCRNALELPPWREPLRLLGAAALTLVCLLAMERTGFLIAMVLLLAGIELMAFERRRVWLATTVLALPLGIWAFFEIILHRPLP